MGHPTIMQNCIKNNKFKAVKYLIKNGVLEECENDIVYFINASILDNHINSIKELMKHVDFKKHVLKHEKLPSFFNRVLDQPNPELFNFFMKKDLIEKFWIFEDEAILNLYKSRNENFQKFVVESFLKKFDVKLKVKIDNSSYESFELSIKKTFAQFLDNKLDKNQVKERIIKI